MHVSKCKKGMIKTWQVVRHEIMQKRSRWAIASVPGSHPASDEKLDESLGPRLDGLYR